MNPNPYELILSDPDVAYVGTDRLIRDFCRATALSFDPTKPTVANPFQAVLNAGVPAALSTGRKMIARLGQLVTVYDSRKENASNAK